MVPCAFHLFAASRHRMWAPGRRGPETGLAPAEDAKGRKGTSGNLDLTLLQALRPEPLIRFQDILNQGDSASFSRQLMGSSTTDQQQASDVSPTAQDSQMGIYNHQ